MKGMVPNGVAAGSPGYLVSPVISVIRIVLCLALVGCSAKEEHLAPPQPQTPKIVVQPSVVVTGICARITATVNPNGFDTDCYFEYGLTSAYGKQLEAKFIQAKLGDVVVSDTIPNLALDSTYHFRLVASNSAGSIQSTDKVFMVANTPPTIVSETSVAVFGNMAVLTATVNANYRSTECYVEYGQTTSYGMHTASKSIGTGGSGIVVRDTITGLGWDSTYHCRLVASNSAGTTQSTDKSFSVASTPPTIVSETSVAVTGPRLAVLTATVNANYRSTDCYFEYGQTPLYGLRTVSKSIGAGGSGVVVRDTIKGLSWDTTYHCRLVAENPAGQTVGSDQTFVCPSAGWAEFLFPLEAGTTWHYTYYYRSSQYVGSSRVDQITGTQLWQSTGSGTGNSIKINVTRIDTTRLWWADTDTTTQISVTDTSFLVVVTPDSLYVQWYRLSHFNWGYGTPDICKIPRTVESNTNTLTIRQGSSSDLMTSIYVAGKGLTSYMYSQSSHYVWDERLTLESMSP